MEKEREKRYLRPDEVADMMGVSRRSVYRYLDAGMLQGFRIKGVVRIDTESVHRAIQAEPGESGLRGG